MTDLLMQPLGADGAHVHTSGSLRPEVSRGRASSHETTAVLSIRPKVGIVVVAYNAESTLIQTLERIPPACRELLSEIIISDDASSDSTSELGAQWAWRNPDLKTHVVRHTKNLGYGGNQKAAYALAIEHGLDAVVLLHGDGQYAPESLPDILAPILAGEADAVFGTRMAVPGAAKAGGMPLYKRLGNKILTSFENSALGTELSEFHSGYRAYTTEVLRRIPFRFNSDVFDFDSQIIMQLVDVGAVIREVPIPTFYGDEICYVNGMKYAKDVVKDVAAYRLTKLGFGNPRWVPPSIRSVHDGEVSDPTRSLMLQYLDELPAGSKILDLGCSDGFFAQRLRSRGHFVVGIDKVEHVGIRQRTDRFIKADLNAGLPRKAGADFDAILLGNLLECLQRPEEVLDSLRAALKPGGTILLSTVNFGHWYARMRVALGTWEYDRAGILHADHLRFFTRGSIRRLCLASGFDVLDEHVSAILGPGTGRGSIRRLRRLRKALAQMRPQLFGRQFLLRLTPHASEMTLVAPNMQGAGHQGSDLL